MTIDEVTAADVKAAVATEDIPHELGAIPRGTVAAQHHEWTAWVGGRPLIVFHAIYLTSSPEKIEPAWDWGKTRYRIVFEGDPPTELTLEGVADRTERWRTRATTGRRWVPSMRFPTSATRHLAGSPIWISV